MTTEQEASVTIVMRARDEASQSVRGLAKSTETAQIASLQLNAALTASGSALTAVGALLSRVDGQAGKTAGTIITTAGAILTTSSAIGHMIPYISQLITYLRSLAIAQALVNALSGPAGWIGLGLAAGAATGIAIASSNSSGKVTGTTVINNIAGTMVTERQVGEITRRSIIKDGDRNASSGVR
jgi:hypothetical protein